MNTQMFSILLVVAIVILQDAHGNAETSVVGKTSSVVSSSSYVSSSSNINGKVSSSSIGDSSVHKNTADFEGSGNEGAIHKLKSKYEGVNLQAANVESGHDGKITKGTTVGINTRFSNDEDKDERGTTSNKKVDQSVFVQVKDPTRRAGTSGGIASRFSESEEYRPILQHSPSYVPSEDLSLKPAGISMSEWAETKRVLDEVLLLQLLNRLQIH